MAAAFVTRLTATAQRLIEKYGMAATLITTASNGTTTSRVAYAVDLGIVKHVLGDSGVNIGDHRLIIEVAGAAPQALDRIQTPDGADRVLVDPIAPIAPSGVPIAYECYSREG